MSRVSWWRVGHRRPGAHSTPGLASHEGVMGADAHLDAQPRFVLDQSAGQGQTGLGVWVASAGQGGRGQGGGPRSGVDSCASHPPRTGWRPPAADGPRRTGARSIHRIGWSAPGGWTTARCGRLGSIHTPVPQWAARPSICPSRWMPSRSSGWSPGAFIACTVFRAVPARAREEAVPGPRCSSAGWSALSDRPTTGVGAVSISPGVRGRRVSP